MTPEQAAVCEAVETEVRDRKREGDHGRRIRTQTDLAWDMCDTGEIGHVARDTAIAAVLDGRPVRLP